MVVVVKWVFSWFVVYLVQVVLVKEVFFRLAVGMCVMVLSFVLAFDSCLWFVWGCLCCVWGPLMVLEVVWGVSLSILCVVSEGYWLYLLFCGLDWKWKLECTDNPWGGVHPPTGILNWWLNLCLIVTVHHLIGIVHHMWLCQDVGVAQLIQSVSVLVCMVLLFHSMTHFLCCWWCTCMSEGGASVLQQLAFTVPDCLLSGSLLGDLLCAWLWVLFWVPFLCNYFLIYSLVPGVWLLAIARVLLIKLTVISCWKICHAMLNEGVLKGLDFHTTGNGGSWNGCFFTQI